MDFLFNVAAAFFVGGFYVALITYVAERINPRLGGILAGLPSTALVGLYFIGLSQGNDVAIKTVVVIPMGLGLIALYVALYTYLRHRYSIIASLLLSIAGWTALAAVFLSAIPATLIASCLIFVACFIIATWYLEKIKVRDTSESALPISQLLIQAALAGTLTALAVVLTNVMGPYIGGLIASFPVIVTTSLILLDKRRGKNFMYATARTVPFGSLGTLGFLVVFYKLVPIVGLGLGTLLAYFASIVAVVISLWVRNSIYGKKGL